MKLNKVNILRIVHGLFALYFLSCLIYVYNAALTGRMDIFLAVALLSLGIEAFIIFILNNGDCPLIHIQRKIGDDKPFFELFFPPRIAKQAIPFFAKLAWLAGILLILRFGFYYFSG